MTLASNKRHHVVPQFYLKKFTTDEGEIRQFDKNKNESILTNTLDIAVHRKFYPQERLQKFECKQAPSIRKLIKKKNYYALDAIDKENVRLFVRHMEIRTEQARSDIPIVQNYMYAPFGLRSRLSPPETQNDMIQDEDKLEHMNFVILENMTKIPFVTSDNPVANHALEIYLPLTPTLTLALLDHRVFKKVEHVQFTNNMHVVYQNFLQLCNSRRFVYSGLEFEPSPEMIKTAKNWKKNSRYDNNNPINAHCRKPSLPHTASYSFDLLDPSKAQLLVDIQNGTRFEHWSQDYILYLMLLVKFLSERRN